MSEASQSYEKLKARFADIQQIRNAKTILARDMGTVMASGSGDDRAQQLVSLTRLAHERLSDPEVGEYLDKAEDGKYNLPDWDRANLKLMQRQYIHATAVPAKLAAEYARVQAVGNQFHSAWLAEGDWEAMRPHWEWAFSVRSDIGAAKRQVLGTDTIYDALIDEFDPYSNAEKIAELFAPVESFLKEAIPQAVEKNADNAVDVDGLRPFSLEKQESLYYKVSEALGFDFSRGVMFMVQQHPSCYGTPDDQRFTTRCSEDEFAESLRAAIHEAGHGMYEQNLPKEWRYQPVGGSLGMTIHESQSLFWEKQIGNHTAFVDFIAPMLVDIFGQEKGSKIPDLMRSSARHIEPSFIRVEADEMTYPMHIFLRFSLEKRLMAGELLVADLPEAWAEGMKDKLGVTPPDNKHGCMQDVHWSQGAVGYFPSYTLGAMTAAQIFAAMEKDISDIGGHIREGKFAALLSWLTDKIHRQGARFKPQDLIAHATGETLNPDYFIAHIKRRFLED